MIPIIVFFSSVTYFSFLHLIVIDLKTIYFLLKCLGFYLKNIIIKN